MKHPEKREGSWLPTNVADAWAVVYLDVAERLEAAREREEAEDRDVKPIRRAA